MKTVVLTANLGNFDHVEKPIQQTLEHDWHCFTDKDFPPIAGLTPRLQYRIPKTHGWQMRPGYDLYVWLDGSMALTKPESLQWLLDQLGDNDMAFFRHPDRKTIKEEVDYLEARKNHRYLKTRYENGLHKEQLADIDEAEYKDTQLWASTVFAYRPNFIVRPMMKEWLYTSVRYFTCDQVALPYLAQKYGVRISRIDLNPFKNDYLKVGSKHK